MSIACPACDSARAERVGSLPVFTADYLGEPLDGQVPQSSLYRCLECGLRFRSPMPTEEQLRNYYGGLVNEEWWKYDDEREVWRYVVDSLTSAPARTVLDVGCFRGDLLCFLGNQWEKFGVEPSKDARRAAESRGIRVVGDTVGSLADSDMRFGAITMIDVVEHLPRPLSSLRILTRLLLPGGRLVVFTGSTAALSWRFAGTQYWYSAMPEHVVFFRPSWFQWAAPRLGCVVESVRRLPFNSVGMRAWVDEALRNVAYVSYKKLENAAVLGPALRRLPVIRRIGSWPGSWWTSASDHVLVTLVKRPEDE